VEKPKTGYLFEIQTADQKQAVPVARDEPLSLGRDPQGDIVLEDRKVSREHARLTWVEGLPCLTDLGSVNGTLLNGRRLPPRIPHNLNDGDVLQIGDYTLTWRQQAASPVVTDGPVLVIFTPEGVQVFPLLGDKLTLGREVGNEIRIENRLVSRWHALLVRSGDGYEIIDLGGTNGLSDGVERISRKTLSDGDVLWITRHISLTYRSRPGEEGSRDDEHVGAGGGDGTPPETAAPTIVRVTTPEAPATMGDAAVAGDQAGGAEDPSPAESAPAPPGGPKTPPETPPADRTEISAPPPGLTPDSTSDAAENPTLLSMPPESSPVDQTVLSVPSSAADPAADDSPTLFTSPPEPPTEDRTVISAVPEPTPDAAENPTLLSTPPESSPVDQTVLSAPPSAAAPAADDSPTLFTSTPEPPLTDRTVISSPPPGADPGAADPPTLLSSPLESPPVDQTAISAPPPETPSLDSTVLSAPSGRDPEPADRPTLLTAVSETPPADLTLLEPLAPGEAGEDLSPASGLPRLAIHLPDRTWEVPLAGDSYSIGREAGNDIVIDHPSISRRHARLERRGEDFVLQDSGSTNGLWLERSAQGRGSGRVDSRILQDGDTLRIGRARLVFKAAFRLEELTMAGVPMLQGRLARRRPVLVVPGIMGSELWLGSERLWPSPRGLLHPEMAAFPGDPRVEARCLVKEVMLVPGFFKLEQYGRLGDYLEAGLGYERGVDLLEFPYDWRQDLRISARRLGEALEAWQVQGPVTIIAHSMGSLVSRYFIERLGGRRMVERLILLGGPHYGAPKMISTLVRGPGLLPFGLMNERLRALLTSFPSGYQMIPTYACVEDQDGNQVNLLEDESWTTADQTLLLRQARAFRRELPSRSSLPTVSIFGYGLKTISKVKVWRGREGRIEKMDFLEELSGDGTVPAVSAVLRRSELHPVRQDHGSLYVDNDVKMRLKLELTRPAEA